MGPARILVIDDDAAVLGAIAQALGVEHELVFAADGAKALALIGSDVEYDLVLCNLVMPSGGGAEIYEETAMLRPELAQRFVFMHDATADDSLRLLALARGAALRKPFTESELRFAVETMLERRSTEPH
jgi:CheY-like chemotaxis protein